MHLTGRVTHMPLASPAWAMTPVWTATVCHSDPLRARYWVRQRQDSQTDGGGVPWGVPCLGVTPGNPRCVSVYRHRAPVCQTVALTNRCPRPTPSKDTLPPPVWFHKNGRARVNPVHEFLRGWKLYLKKTRYFFILL